MSQGETFVFVHGAGMDATVWNDLQPHIAGKCIALNLPGHGGTKGAPLASIQEMGAWLAEYLMLKKSFVLCGHSMGGLVALAAAAQLGDRLKGLVLLGVNAEMRVNDDLLATAEKKPDDAAAMILKWGVSPTAPPEAGEKVGSIMKAAGPGVLARDLSACNIWRNTRETAQKIRKPALVIAGEDDKMTPAAKAQNLAGFFVVRADIEVLPATGHMMMIEKPKETADIINSFVAGKLQIVR